MKVKQTNAKINFVSQESLCSMKPQSDWDETKSWGLCQILRDGFIHYQKDRTLSLTGRKYKIQAAQKNTELFQRNSREGGLKKKENRNLERGGWKNKNNKTQLNRDNMGGRSDLKQEWGAQPNCGHPLCEQDKIAGHAMVEEL